MKRLLLVLCSCTLLACPKPVPTPDAGPEGEVPYEGDATGNLPGYTSGVVDAGLGTPIDAGAIVTETRCCKLSFSLAPADVPPEATGRVVGDASPLNAGVALTATDAGYVGGACVPINTATWYWYEFQWVTNDADAGGYLQADGGMLMVLSTFDPGALNYSTPDGNRNFIPSVSDCATLDAGTGS